MIILFYFDRLGFNDRIEVFNIESFISVGNIIIKKVFFIYWVVCSRLSF